MPATCRPRACSRPPRGCPARPIWPKRCSRRSAWTPRWAWPRPTRLAHGDGPGSPAATARRSSSTPSASAVTRRRRPAASRLPARTGRSSRACSPTARPAGATLLARETVDEFLAPQFGPLPGGVSGVGEWPDLCWGLGFDVRAATRAALGGPTLSARAASHFGASGTLAWLDPSCGPRARGARQPRHLLRLVARAVGRARRRGDGCGRSGVDPAMRRIRTRPGAGPEAFDEPDRVAPRRRPPLPRLPDRRPGAGRDLHCRRLRAGLEPARPLRPAPRRPARWLLAIARSCALDHLRAERRRGARERLAAHASRCGQAEDAAGLSDGYSAALETALGKLSAADREVIALRVLLELDAGEAARLIGITPTACTTRLSRALARLAAEVEAHEHV